MVHSSWVSVNTTINYKKNDLIKFQFTQIFPSNSLAEEAALASFEQRDLQNLYTVHMNATKNNDRALVAKVENYIEKLSEKR